MLLKSFLGYEKIFTRGILRLYKSQIKTIGINPGRINGYAEAANGKIVYVGTTLRPHFYTPYYFE